MKKHFPLPMIRSVYAAFDKRVADTLELARVTDGKTSPCKRGCSACCSEPLVVTQYCMPPIIEAIRAMSTTAHESLKQRILEWSRLVESKGIHVDQTDPGLDFAAWHRQPKPACPLLELSTGECMIYEARPMGCRGHVSIEQDATPCDREDPEQGVAVLLFTDEIGRVMGHIMSHSVRGKPKDVALLILLLPSMLRRAWILIEQPTMSYFQWFEEIDRRARTGERI